MEKVLFDCKLWRILAGMTADQIDDEYVDYDNMPLADEAFIRAHREELIAMAENLGLTNVRYASRNRLVVTPTDAADALSVFELSAKASLAFGFRVRAFSDKLFVRPGVSEDLKAAQPL